MGKGEGELREIYKKKFCISFLKVFSPYVRFQITLKDVLHQF